MLNRRHLLISAGAVTALAGRAGADEVASPSQQVSMVLDAIYAEMLQVSPQSVTALGLDKGPRAAAKHLLDDQSLGARAKALTLVQGQVRRLQAIDRADLPVKSALDHDSVLEPLEVNARLQALGMGSADGIPSPYVLSQLTGAYQAIPDFLGTQHVIETADDAEAYLDRLSAFATVLDQEAEKARHDQGRGVIPPDFVIERTLTQMGGLLGAPEASPLVTSVGARAKEKGLTGDYAGRAAAIYRDSVTPALQRQVELMKSLQPNSVHDAGVWRLPQGEAYYGLALQYATTTKLSPDEVHQMGLDQARELSARAETILQAQGMTQGTVGARIRALYNDPKHHYPNTDAGKQVLLGDLNKLAAAMSARLPEYFATVPKIPVEIRRVPTFIEAGAPGGYYNSPSLDGTRPGIFWINLRDSAENPRWSLPTLVYHEAVPGHHLQLVLQQGADLPDIRRTGVISAYAEGWALYAEELAREMGVYEGDPLAELGYLQAALFRSARLVVDTGMHAKRWSREQAIQAMTDIDGSPATAAATEIERYCVWPGQACSYMVGKLTWVRIRERARAALGARFDLRRFHDAGLLDGAMPMTVLERHITDWTKTQLA